MKKGKESELRIMNIRNGSLSYLVLLSLEKAVEKALLLENFSYSGQMKALHGLSVPPSKKTLAETIRRLRLGGMIEYEREADGQIIIKLSALGSAFLEEKKEASLDGKYRIVIWDIPESKRAVRNTLRQKLKDWGFISLQRSVWISQRNVTTQLRKLITNLGMERWVIVIESDDPTLQGQFAKLKIR